MNVPRRWGWIISFMLFTWLTGTVTWSDGGYITRIESESIALSVDQRAIIVKNGDEISMTFSTGYTGEGEDFGWLIPTPVPPAVEDVFEAGKSGEKAFEMLDEISSPTIRTHEMSRTGGCFPAGTEVLTAEGLQTIESVIAGTEVFACELTTGRWVLSKILKRQSFRWEGDMVTIQIGGGNIRATGNQPFYVSRGDRLSSRPLPEDVPIGDQKTSGNGRWVEARDLKEGDVLKKKSGDGAVITGLLSHQEKNRVYCLEVEEYHNCAVHRVGVLAHNGGKKEETGAAIEEVSAKQLVTVYGTVTLEHFEASILGAADASALLNWLEQNEYQVNPEAREVLDSYIDRKWAFVAVKLNPSEKRHYENEFLTPLTIRYQYDGVIFPLHISSVSTAGVIKFTLYVIAESTVSSSNFSTARLLFQEYPSELVAPEDYIESCILATLAREGERGMIVMWSGGSREQDILNNLIKKPYPRGQNSYLTRLETRMGPESMTEDIILVLDPQPKEFQVSYEVEVSRDYKYPPAKSIAVALRMASELGEIDAVRTLLKQQADVNARSAKGVTALMRAAAAGHAETVRALIEAGAVIGDSFSRSALLYASEAGHIEVVQILLEAGAEVGIWTMYGSTALMAAAQSGHIEIVKLLLQAGADVYVTDRDGYTALMKAAGEGHVDVVQSLLQAGADSGVNARSGYGWTALLEAADGGHAEIVQILLECGADVEAKTGHGWTALMRAAEKGHIEVVEFLLQAGADVNTISKSGWTALTYARRSGHTQCAELLRKSIETKGEPVITDIRLREHISDGRLIIYQDIYFYDLEGDAYYVDYELVSTTAKSVNVVDGSIRISIEKQKSGTFITGKWTCGGIFSTTLRVTLIDRAGNRSKPIEYTLNCR